MTERIDVYPIGGCWEKTVWEVHHNVDVRVGKSFVIPCEHASPSREVVTTRSDGTTFSHYVVTVPRVVVAENEGGYNTTGVCLDCVLKYTSITHG